MMKWLKNVTAALGTGGMIVLIVIVLGSSIAMSMFSPLRDFFDTGSKGQITTSQTIVQNIQPLGQLVSVNAQVAKVGVEVKIRRGLGNICYFWGIHAAQAEISAGIDLTQVSAEDIQFDEATNTYNISLPAAQLTSCNLDPIATQQYDKGGDTPVCRIDWDEVRRLASYVALRQFRDEVVEGGLLSRAEKQASVTLGSFISALNGANVNITYKDRPAAASYPPSCNPQTPGTWRWDEAVQRWVEE